MSGLFPVASTTTLVAGLLVGLVTLFVGAALVYDGGRRVRFYRRARSTFERVDATVVESAVLRRSPGDAQAVPRVTYEYRVDGETYSSRSLWPTLEPEPPRVDAGLARRVVEDYPEGAEVIARYDPGDPTTAYLLESGDARRQYGEVVAGCLLAAVGASLVVGLALG